jgi:hypothetical protein
MGVLAVEVEHVRSQAGTPGPSRRFIGGVYMARTRADT